MAVEFSPFRRIVKIVADIGIYLESGFLNLLSSGQCAENAYKPGILDYDAETAAYVAGTSAPLQGRVKITGGPEADEFPFAGEALAAGSESLAVGCKQKLPAVTDPCGNTYTGGGYCDAGIFAKKDAQYIVPSSMFSGKLRLFVQAVYGTARTDYRRSGNFDLQIGDESPFVLKRGWSNNSWLYTTARYDYFLCTFTGSAIEFRQVALSASGKKFRDILAEHPRKSEFDFATKVEAYILATGTVGSAVYATVPIEGDAINGSPLDYGWHATWDGRQAAVVCFYKDPGNPQYLSDQHQLTLGETWDGSAYTFVAGNTRLVADAPWWPWTNGLNVFYYDETTQQMQPVPYPDATPGGFEGTFDAPIYCYYHLDPVNGSSILETVDIKMNIRDRTSENISVNTGKHYAPDDFSVIDRLTYHSNAQGEKGFQIGEETFNVFDTDIQDLHEWTYSKKSGPTIIRPFVTLSGGEPFRDDLPNNTPNLWALNEASPSEGEEHPTNSGVHAHVRINYYSYDVTRQIKTNIAETGSAFFETVLGSCSSIVIGTRQERVHDEISKTVWTGVTRAFGCGMYWVRDFDSLVVSGELDSMGGAVFLAPWPHNSILTFFPSTTETVPGNPGSIDINVADYVHAETARVGYTTASDTAASDEYFKPTVSDPGTNSVDTARSSIGGKAKIEHKLYVGDYGFLFDSSIGWQ